MRRLVCISDFCTHCVPTRFPCSPSLDGTQRRGAVSRTEPLRGVREGNRLARQAGAGTLKDHPKGDTLYPVCQEVHMLIYPANTSIQLMNRDIYRPEDEVIIATGDVRIMRALTRHYTPRNQPEPGGDRR